MRARHIWQDKTERRTSNTADLFSIFLIYCISILEGYSRAILASAVTHRQNFEEYVVVLYAAIRKHGCPEVLVSDHGKVFRDHRALQIYTALGIDKKEISWQNLIETALYVTWNCLLW